MKRLLALLLGVFIEGIFEISVPNGKAQGQGNLPAHAIPDDLPLLGGRTDNNLTIGESLRSTGFLNRDQSVLCPVHPLSCVFTGWPNSSCHSLKKGI
jgi:hypothetical protein